MSSALWPFMSAARVDSSRPTDGVIGVPDFAPLAAVRSWSLGPSLPGVRESGTVVPEIGQK
jgi:hypothetical protein